MFNEYHFTVSLPVSKLVFHWFQYGTVFQIGLLHPEPSVLVPSLI